MANIIRDLWLRLHFLVPDPLCKTFADDLDRLIWGDGRTQPTETAIRAVTQAQIDSVDPGKVAAALRSSAATKLIGLGLTADEVRAIFEF